MEYRNMVNKIAAYGCSFTEGQELPDEMFINNAEKKKQKMGWQKFSKKFRHIIHSEDYLKEAKNLAWPKYVADLYGVEYYNNALGGSSLESVCQRLTLDLNRKVIDSNTLILIGLPNITRWVHPLRTMERHFLSNMLEINDKELEAMSYAVVMTDAKLLHYYYSGLEYLELLAQKHNLNIKTYGIWEHVPDAILNLKDQVTLHYYEYMTVRWNSLEKSSMFNWETKMSDFSQFPNSTLGGGHFTVKVHKDFAEYVYKQLKR
jgi:hypothetical protein